MRPSRGMGIVDPKKLSKATKKNLNRTQEQPKGANDIGVRKKAAENFGNLSKYYKGK